MGIRGEKVSISPLARNKIPFYVLYRNALFVEEILKKIIFGQKIM